MGKMSVILVFAAILIGGTVLYSMQQSSLQAGEHTSANQLESMARNAAHAGLERELRDVFRTVTATIPPGDWSSFQRLDVPYNGGTYSVVGEVGDCSGVDINSAQMDSIRNRPNFNPSQHLIDVTATGTYPIPRGQRYQDMTEIQHQVQACYVRLDQSDPVPPAFDYAFISNDNFRFNAGIDVKALDGEGNIHSNDDMYLGPNVDINGHVTYEESADGTLHNNASASSFEPGPGVPMEPFDPEEYRPEDMHDLYTTPDDIPGGDFQIGDEAYGKDGTAPFVWFHDGDLTLDGTQHLHLPGHTTIIVTGEFKVGGSANITATNTLPTDPQYDDTEEWIEHNIDESGDVKAAFFVDDDIEIHGSGSIVGNLFTNGDFTLSGGGTGSNLVGSVSAVGEIDGRGGGTGRNFWYASISEQNVIPGVKIPLELISMIAISEWGNDMLYHASN